VLISGVLAEMFFGRNAEPAEAIGAAPIAAREGACAPQNQTGSRLTLPARRSFMVSSYNGGSIQ